MNIIPDGNEIVGISRNISEGLEGINPNVTYECCNLLDHSSVYETLRTHRPDIIIHLAAESSVASSWKGPVNMLTNNLISQVNILEAARELGLMGTRVVVACSSEEYGLVGESDIPVDEDCGFKPLSAYAVSKIAQDMSAYQYHKSYGMDIVRARSFNLIGPGQAKRYALSSFAMQIANIESEGGSGTISVGNLDVVRDYTDVRSAMEAYLRIADSAESGTVYNICSGKGHRMRDLLYRMVEMSDCEIDVRVDPTRFRPSDLPVMIGDNTKIQEDLGWEPRIDIDESLRDLLEFWRERTP